MKKQVLRGAIGACGTFVHTCARGRTSTYMRARTDKVFCRGIFAPESNGKEQKLPNRWGFLRVPKLFRLWNALYIDLPKSFDLYAFWNRVWNLKEFWFRNFVILFINCKLFIIIHSQNLNKNINFKSLIFVLLFFVIV